MEGLSVREEALEGVVRGCLEIGMTEFQRGQMSEALQHFEKALELNPNSVEVLNNCGAVLGKMGRYVEAINKFDQVMETKPNSPVFWANRGLALGNLGRLQEALESFEHALKLKHDDPNTLHDRGVSLYKLGRKEEALESFERALKIKPDYILAWYSRGVVLGDLDKTDAAIASYDSALKIDPEHTSALHNRSLAYLIKFVKHISNNKIDAAKDAWNESVTSAKKANDNRWLKSASEGLLLVARFRSADLALQLIQSSGVEEQFFPLARAFDYLQKGDKALLEKLSPEVRGVVEEIVAKLSQVDDQIERPKSELRPKKVKSGARRGTRKKLR
jgi:tetratricopeptide (TPR) repeat protein